MPNPDTTNIEAFHNYLLIRQTDNYGSNIIKHIDKLSWPMSFTAGEKPYVYNTLPGIVQNFNVTEKDYMNEDDLFLPLPVDINVSEIVDKSPLVKLGDNVDDVPCTNVVHSSLGLAKSSLDSFWPEKFKFIRSTSLRLHNEIVEFCHVLEPTSAEIMSRELAVVRISNLIQRLFPQAKIIPFGSYVTGLYLPTSDMDVVVTQSGCNDIPRALKAIAHELVEQGTGKSIQVISRARVPIVKFTDIISGLAFDVSFDIANGASTANYVITLMKSLPPMKYLVKILKLFLQQRELNEVYQGGIGSYALLVMVAAFLLQHPSRFVSNYKFSRRQKNNNKLESNLGILLMDFFRLYGRALDMEQVGVSCRKGGKFFKKRDSAFYQCERPYLLAIQDPRDELNDLGRASYNIVRVQKAFDFAYQQLSTPLDSQASILQRIIRIDAILLSRIEKEMCEPSDQELCSEMAAKNVKPVPYQHPRHKNDTNSPKPKDDGKQHSRREKKRLGKRDLEFDIQNSSKKSK